MKIYFAAAMRGGRDNLATNQQMVAYLSSLNHEILNLKVTDEDFDAAETGMTDRQIYDRDMQLLQHADVLIAEATTPSLGTGYEIAEALHRGIPVLCLHRSDTAQPFSALIAAIPHPSYRCISYRGDGWRNHIDEFLNTTRH